MKTKNPRVVLLVDDEESFFDLYAWHLEKHEQLTFLHAQSGHAAFKVVENQKVDVVISDINMPNGDGFWLLDKLTKNYQHIPVIIASGNCLYEKNDLVKLGARDFVPKLEMHRLEASFSRLL